MRTVFSKRVNYINIHTYINMDNLFVDFITIKTTSILTCGWKTDFQEEPSRSCIARKNALNTKSKSEEELVP